MLFFSWQQRNPQHVRRHMQKCRRSGYDSASLVIQPEHLSIDSSKPTGTSPHLVQREPEACRKADRSQHPQWVILEGSHRRQRRANDAVTKIVHASKNARPTRREMQATKGTSLAGHGPKVAQVVRGRTKCGAPCTNRAKSYERLCGSTTAKTTAFEQH